VLTACTRTWPSSSPRARCSTPTAAAVRVPAPPVDRVVDGTGPATRSWPASCRLLDKKPPARRWPRCRLAAHALNLVGARPCVNYLADLFSLAGGWPWSPAGVRDRAGMAPRCRAGAQVVLIARTSAAEAATEELRQAGGQLTVSATWPTGRRWSGRRAAPRRSGPDILVNCAGINLRPPLGSLTVADWT